jgi:transcriptional regulator GlxA family with amidase domain
VAETGLLDNRETTTTWWLSPLFRQRYPKVLLDESRMLVPTDIGVTAGAEMGHIDLALWLVRKASPDLAAVVSRYLLADIRSSQAPYIIPNLLAQADPLILRFERWAREHLQKGFSLQEAAATLATSPRSLQRRCQEVLGKSPLSYFQDLRVERAQNLIHGSRLDIDAIAAEVGCIDGPHLRTLLRQRLGRGVVICGPICADQPAVVRLGSPAIRASRNARCTSILLKNSQIEQLRKSRSCAHSVV